jgi:16S rRNA (guanine966-N2)-methyltransferase
VGRIRIIAGALRGRRIEVPSGLSVRPTPDRVREALFSALGHDLDGQSVMDAYAGSGALGFEALSRGAERVTFMEREANAVAAIRANAALLGVETVATILSGDVETLLLSDRLPGPFDLVIADPPYDHGPAGPLLTLLAAPGVLRGGATVVFQRDSKTPAVDDPAGPISWTRTRRYGRTCLDYYTVAPSGTERLETT